ncbi:MAG: DUF2027 domain-containing protein [Dysgonomonas sp.]
MKIGDKVRFLNTTGGGTVKGFEGKNIVIVDDDGFDTPMLIKECVVIGSDNIQAKESSIQNVVSAIATSSQAEPKKETEPFVVEETKEGEQITVCLCYLPVDIKQLSTSAYECYLVNDSNYYLYYNYMSRADNGWISRAAGIIEPNIKIYLEEFDKTELNDLEKVCLQFIALKKDKPFSLKNPCSVELRIDPVKFYKLHSFRENDYFDENALVYYVMKKDLQEKEYIINTEELQNAILQKENPKREKRQRIEKKESSPILEVDLHIDELLDNTNGLEPKDLLEYQLKKFNEVMNENLKKKGQKIVFIHGKGNGTLKNALLNELKTKYKNIYYQDASFREYGFGATMVTIQ